MYVINSVDNTKLTGQNCQGYVFFFQFWFLITSSFKPPIAVQGFNVCTVVC